MVAASSTTRLLGRQSGMRKFMYRERWEMVIRLQQDKGEKAS
jgi:hypothetical protein